MTTWGSINCGGYPSVKLANPDGTHCKTVEKDFNPGDTVVWSGQGLANCRTMELTLNSTLYIQTSSGNDFCPKNVVITPKEGPAYAVINEISDWYDKDKTNNKSHKLRECKFRTNNL